MTAKKRILRREDMKPPTLGNLEVLRLQLVEILKFSPHEAIAVTQFLNDIVPPLARAINAHSSAPSPSKDRATVRSAIKSLNRANWYLARCGLHAQMMVEPSLGPLGEMFSVGWLRENMAAGHYLQAKGSSRSEYARTGRRAAARTSPRGGSFVDIEQDSQEDRYYFLKQYGLPVLTTVLAKLEKELKSGLRGSAQRGRKENTYRKYFVRQLVALWKYQLRRPSPQTIGSDLAEFCHQVFEFIGWPMEGLDAAVQKEISSYSRN